MHEHENSELLELRNTIFVHDSGFIDFAVDEEYNIITAECGMVGPPNPGRLFCLTELSQSLYLIKYRELYLRIDCVVAGWPGSACLDPDGGRLCTVHASDKATCESARDSSGGRPCC